MGLFASLGFLPEDEALPAGAPQNATGFQSGDAERLAELMRQDGDVSEDDIREIVLLAIGMYGANGEAMFDHINDQPWNDSAYRLFVTGYETKDIVADSSSGAAGAKSAILESYAKDKYDALLDGIGDGAWIEHSYLDPETADDLLTRSWVVPHDEYLFAAGYVMPAPNRILEIVEESIAAYDARGELAFESINASPSVNPHYPLIIDAGTMEVVAHGAFPKLVGTEFAGIGIPAASLVEELEDLQGVWVYTTVTNPENGEDSQKRSWLVLHEGYLFSSGYYYPASEKVISIVRDAVERYKMSGPAVLADINALRDDTPHYLFVLDAETNTVAAHSSFPDRVGANSFILDGKAGKAREQIIEELVWGTGTWLDYSFLDPHTGSPDHKRTYMELHDKYVFGSGYYGTVFSQFTHVP